MYYLCGSEMEEIKNEIKNMDKFSNIQKITLKHIIKSEVSLT